VALCVAAHLCAQPTAPASASTPPPCPQDSELRADAHADALRELRRRVDAAPPACANDAGFLALRGALALKDGRPADASVLLEKAVMLDPTRAGAILDYALAREALGDPASARSLYRELLDHHAPPPALRALIERRLDGLASIAVAGDARSRWSGSVALLAGYDGNLNSAPRLTTLTLTTPEGLLELELDPASRARGGAVAVLDGRINGVVALGAATGLRVQGRVVAREPPGRSEYRSQIVDAEATLVRPALRGRALLAAGAFELNFGGESLLRGQRLGVGYEAPALAGFGAEGLRRSCASQLLIEAESRSYPLRPDLDGRLLHFGARLLCNSNDRQTFVGARFTRDAPRGTRAGGAQQRVEMQAASVFPWGGGRLRLQATVAVSSDDSPYNPLIQQGEVRRIQWLAGGIEYSRPMGGGLEGVIGFDVIRQWSSISLFRTRGETLLAGVRKAF